jgi:hypothetical protein
LLLRSAGRAPEVDLFGENGPARGRFVPAPVGDEPGVYRVVFGKLPEGRYDARIAGAAKDDAAAGTAFEVRDLSEEMLDLKSRPDLMARIAAESGGRALEGAETAPLLEQMHAHQKGLRTRELRRTPIWDHWWVLSGAVAVWASAWVLRRSAGLV